MEIETRDPRFASIVDRDAALERLVTGCKFTEGPVWHPVERQLIFSDMPDDHMRRWRPGGGIETFRRPSNMANGNAYDRQGRLITCEHASSRLTRTEADGRIVTLASHHEGKQLNSPNDVAVRRDGAIYFTDPSYGRMDYYGVKREPELSYRGLYRLSPDGRSLRLLADDFGQPNGLCFAADERRLFVNDTERQHIRAFAVQADGSLADGRLFAETKGEGAGAPDGMKLDAQGNVYCAGPGGIHVFDPAGIALGVVRMPEYTANFCFGDDDLRTLYVCAATSLYRLRLRTPGLSLL
ncbi:MAG: SMP-30/gluconolactonase/LRE family protein [Alphaproteobacteria bacterium]|nr:SMP-30/gluconolactonase/LRE family protein [Alphaproteobacteria bacterium]